MELGSSSRLYFALEFGTCHKQKITFYDKDSFPLVHYNLMPGPWAEQKAVQGQWNKVECPLTYMYMFKK